MNTATTAKDYMSKVSEIITSEEPNYLKLAFIYNVVKSFEDGEAMPNLPLVTKSTYSQAKEVFDLV